MLNLLKTFRCGARRRGSALLIVLGFLSFMVISGVSFAIYMRTERQASSNYRHAVNGRHLLNAGLARAMEEIDSELRLDNNDVNDNDKKHPKRCELKFPFWWDGVNNAKPTRVRTSAVEDDADNERDARVLSIESLSYLPPFLVNDVRRYAAWQPGDEPYEGAKWRSLEGSVFGRYAYVCVNVSDMLDVNQCRAQLRDVSTNRVSLGHLFETDTQRTDFDQDAEDDGHYFSLQDFYATRYERAKNEVSSPFHMYIKNGNFQPFENSDLRDQVFIADSIAKHEPVKKVGNNVGCNIWLNPPFAPNIVNKTLVDNALSGNLNTDFLNAFKKAVQSPIQDANNFAAMVKDYMDKDCVPSRLFTPTLERVPMVSEIVLDNGVFCPKIVTSTKQVGDPVREVTVYSVQLFGMPVTPPPPDIEAPLYVELVWPFKLGKTRPGSDEFDLELECYLRLHRPHQPMSTTGWPSDPDNRNIYIPLKHTRAPIQRFWANDDFPSEQDCFYKMDTEVEAPRSDVVVNIVDSDGNYYNGFANGQEFSVSFVIFARVRKQKGGEYVDCAPQGTPNYPDPSTFEETPKLYFQTQPRMVGAVATMSTQPINYEWTGLEVADPRFNHNAANWVPNNAIAAPANFVGKNSSTKKLLEDPSSLAGRDADIFMFVSDSGTLWSPGELGFIVRPDTFNDPTGPTRDFHTADLEPVDKDYMFRTIRLYDHGASYKQDELYDYLYAANADGTLPGARVNPLSDLPEVLEAAIWDTPMDYWVASTNNNLKDVQRLNLTFTTTFTRNDLENEDVDVNKPRQDVSPFKNTYWRSLADKWVGKVLKVSKVMNPPLEMYDPNTLWSKNFSDYYGDHTRFEWYSADATRKNIFGINVLNPLHEIDRKMLYSFSLDSFSDRQQLFLYFIRAEATVPSFGGGTEVGMQSLAGGRAVALVWRDPYPRGFVKDDDENNDNRNDTMQKDSDWYPNNHNYISPWDQYPTPYHGAKMKRYEGYHDTRVLFFKQLGQ